MVIGTGMANTVYLFQRHPKADLRSQNLALSILALPLMVEGFKPSLIGMVGRIMLLHTVRANFAMISIVTLKATSVGNKLR